jgi:hypothetical protein
MTIVDADKAAKQTHSTIDRVATPKIPARKGISVTIN